MAMDEEIYNSEPVCVDESSYQISQAERIMVTAAINGTLQHEQVLSVVENLPENVSDALWREASEISIDPVRRRLLGMGIGQGIVVDGYPETDSSSNIPIWHDRAELGTIIGSRVMYGRTIGALRVIHPESNAPMTPGFDRIDLLSNEGMLAHIGPNPYVLEASNPLEAARRHLRSNDEGLMAYPIFLSDHRFSVVRLDPDNARNIHQAILRVLDKNHFANDEDSDWHDSTKAKQRLDMVLEVIHNHERYPQIPIEYEFDAELAVNTEYFPMIDHNNLRAQLVVSRPVEGGMVVSLAGTLDKQKKIQGGFTFIMQPNGTVKLIGIGENNILHDDQPDSDPYGNALGHFLRYNGGIIKQIYSRPMQLPDGTVINPKFN